MSEPINYCLLFDSDGTLVDSESISMQALADELALHNIHEDSMALLALYRGWQFKAVLSDVSKRHGVILDQQFELSFRARASRYFEGKLQPIAGIYEALQQLTDTKCVASNAPMAKLNRVLEITKLKSFFASDKLGDCLFSAYDILKFKPLPDLFLTAAETMGFTPDKCIVIEDSTVGVEAAIAAHMKCVWYSPEGSHESIDKHEDDEKNRIQRIANMSALPAAIDALKRQGQ